MRERLGQHFLKDRKILQKIVLSLEIKRGDTVIEIGPGHGELTTELRIKNKELRIIAIEKDLRLAENLKNKFVNDKKIEIVQGDALQVLPRLILNSKFLIHSWKLVGNLPYYITGRLFRVLGELITNNKLPITLAVFTIQKEVAERLVARPPNSNLLSASVQIWADPKIISTIPPGAFNPQPKVWSAIIRLKTNPSLVTSSPVTSYYKMLRILFKQPRKTILNNLADGLGESKVEITEKLKKIGIKPADRPQNLDLEKIVELSRIFLATS